MIAPALQKETPCFEYTKKTIISAFRYLVAGLKDNGIWLYCNYQQDHTIVGFPSVLWNNKACNDRSIVILDFEKDLREIGNRHQNGPEMVGLELDGLAKAWINDCARTHPLCPKPQDAILPTRLLDVGDAAESLESLHLVIPGETTEGKWIALSYCWGESKLNNKTYRTTTKNLEDHLRQIPFEKLPLTIQDAIRVTRSLCIRYLWVDALCIIQDSNKDWQVESVNMMNVYRNSYITITANTGDNANSGLCIDRNVLECRPCVMNF